MAQVYNWADEYVAHMRPVKKEVRRELDNRAARVKAVVSAHVETGAVKRSLKVRTNYVDSTVSISDPAILSINYGHWHNKNRRVWVSGIHAIEAAL